MVSFAKWSAVAAGAVWSSLSLAAPADAWEPQRAGRWEGAIQGRYQNYDNIRFTSAITLDAESGWGAGATFGYNFDPYLNLSLEVFGNDADYNGTVVAEDGRIGTVDGSLDSSSGQFNVTYHWFDSAFTPFVAAGLGWTYIDSNIFRRFSGTECFFHPWYGHVCGDVIETYDDTVFSYNAAVGLRWDITRDVFVRGSVGRQWVYLDETSTHPSIDFGRIEVGMMF